MELPLIAIFGISIFVFYRKSKSEIVGDRGYLGNDIVIINFNNIPPAVKNVLHFLGDSVVNLLIN